MFAVYTQYCLSCTCLASIKWKWNNRKQELDSNEKILSIRIYQEKRTSSFRQSNHGSWPEAKGSRLGLSSWMSLRLQKSCGLGRARENKRWKKRRETRNIWAIRSNKIGKMFTSPRATSTIQNFGPITSHMRIIPTFSFNGYGTLVGANYRLLLAYLSNG